MIGGAATGTQDDARVATHTVQDGSLGTSIDVANGDPVFDKVRVEEFWQGQTAVFENWRIARLRSSDKAQKLSPAASAEGNAVEIAAIVEAITPGGRAPLPLGEAVSTTLATFEIVDSLANTRATPIGQGMSEGE